MRRSRLLGWSLAVALPVAMFAAAPASAAPDPGSGLSLPANLRGAVVTTVITPSDETGPNLVTTTTTYDDRGNITDLLQVATDSGGAIVQREEVQFLYDSAGRLHVQVDVNDGDGDGPQRPQTIVTTTTYDKKGFALSTVRTFDNTSDGVIDASETTTFSSDHHGRTLVTTTHDDRNGDGIDDETHVVSNTYDGHGRLTRKVDQDYESGVLAHTQTTEIVYGTAGRVSTETVRETNGTGALTFASITELGYDGSGDLTSSRTTTDYDGDGQQDNQVLQTNTYDSSRRQLQSQVTEVALVTHILLNSTSFDFTYDSLGRLVGAVESVDENGDGTVDLTDTSHLTLDALGRLVHSVDTVANQPANVVEYSAVSDWSYDGKGRISRNVVAITQGSSQPSVTTTAYSYVSKTTVVITTSFDGNGDGVVDSSYTITRTIA